MSNLKISIPAPCHENWEAMTPAEKGRFCGSCQKVVHDFRRSSDREIREIYLQDANTCGRFLSSQLDRNLIINEPKTNRWLAASAAAISFLTLGTHESFSQTGNPIEQFQGDSSKKDKVFLSGTFIIQGVVRDEQELLIPRVSILNLNTGRVTCTDDDGKFSFEVSYNDIIECSFIGYTTSTFIVNRDSYQIQLIPDEALENAIVDIYGRPGLQKPTFFGRIFYRIGNLFR